MCKIVRNKLPYLPPIFGHKNSLHELSTVFDLINTHTPICAESSNSIVLQPVYFLILCTIQMSIHNICFYKEIQKEKKKTKKKKNTHTKTPHKHHLIRPLLTFFFLLKCTFSIGRCIFYHKFSQYFYEINIKKIAFGNKEHTIDKKMGVSVLLRLFISSNEVCNTAYAL